MLTLRFLTVPLLLPLVLLGSARESAAQNPPGLGDPQTTALTSKKVFESTAVPEGYALLTLSINEAPAPGIDLGRQPSLAQVAAAFNRTQRRFGHVITLAPQSRVGLNTRLDKANIYAGLPATQAFRLLLAGLSESQWQLLISPNGLPFQSLRDDVERQLFIASVPSQKLRVLEIGKPVPFDLRTLPEHQEEIRWSSLRLGQQTRIYLPQGTNGENYVSPLVPGKYAILADGSGASEEMYGLISRVEVPNTPKPSQLNYDLPALATAIPISGLKTVSDVVDQVRNTTGIEIYADPRLGNKSVSIATHLSSVPAGDLLQALAFCAAGTYRKVETAFVLTDDLLGVAARKEAWRQLDVKVAAALEKEISLADPGLTAKMPTEKLASFDKNTELTEAQRKAGKETPFGIFDIEVPLSGLTEAQQAEARRAAELLPKGSNSVDPFQSGNIRLITLPQVELLLPSLDTAVTIPDAWNVVQAYVNAQRKPKNVTPPAAPKPLGPQAIPQPLMVLPNRALLITADAIPKIPDLIGEMKRIGLNQLWIPVGTAPSSGTADAPVSTDDLKSALAAVKGKGIAVFAVISPFARFDASPQSLELTLFGQNSSASEPPSSESGGRKPAPPADRKPLLVSPFAEQTQQELTQLARELSLLPELGGIVLRGTAPPGYNKSTTTYSDDGRPEFGYTEAGRLAFLQKYHADPIDVDVRYPALTKANTSIPNFDDETSVVEKTLSDAWSEMRTAKNVEVLRNFYTVLKKQRAPGAFVTLVKQRRSPIGGSWYGPWSSPGEPLPGAVSAEVSLTEPAVTNSAPVSKGATISVPLMQTMVFPNLPFRRDHYGWSGFVLDAAQGLDTVAALRAVPASSGELQSK